MASKTLRGDQRKEFYFSVVNWLSLYLLDTLAMSPCRGEQGPLGSAGDRTMDQGGCSFGQRI